MLSGIENIKNTITYTLANDGAFVNFIERELLEDTIGSVCCIENDIYILGVLLAMKMDTFYPIKYLIPILNSKKRQKELLNIFIETLKNRFKLGVNWRILLAPIKKKQKTGENYLFNIERFYRGLRFINMCGTQGIKILHHEMLLKSKTSPIKLPNENEYKLLSKNILKLWFLPLNRNAYLASLRQAINTFKRNLHNEQFENIKKTVVAQLLFSIFESYDLRRMLDITESLTPYYVFTGINRNELRNYATFTLSRLMGTYRDDTPMEMFIDKYGQIQNNLEILLNNMRLEKVIEFLKSEGIFFEVR